MESSACPRRPSTSRNDKVVNQIARTTILWSKNMWTRWGISIGLVYFLFDWEFSMLCLQNYWQGWKLFEQTWQNNIPVLQQVLYSPNNAPCDFWQFSTLKKMMKGALFESQEIICRTRWSNYTPFSMRASNNGRYSRWSVCNPKASTLKETIVFEKQFRIKVAPLKYQKLPGKYCTWHFFLCFDLVSIRHLVYCVWHHISWNPHFHHHHTWSQKLTSPQPFDIKLKLSCLVLTCNIINRLTGQLGNHKRLTFQLATFILNTVYAGASFDDAIM